MFMSLLKLSNNYGDKATGMKNVNIFLIFFLHKITRVQLGVDRTANSKAYPIKLKLQKKQVKMRANHCLSIFNNGIRNKI